MYDDCGNFIEDIDYDISYLEGDSDFDDDDFELDDEDIPVVSFEEVENYVAEQLEDVEAKLDALSEQFESKLKTLTEIFDERLRIAMSINKPVQQVPADDLKIKLESIIDENAPDMAKRLMNTIAAHYRISNKIYQKFAYLGQII